VPEIAPRGDGTAAAPAGGGQPAARAIRQIDSPIDRDKAHIQKSRLISYCDLQHGRDTSHAHPRRERMTTVTSAPGMAAVDPAAAIPMADWGSLVLRAGRFGPILPHISWLLRFSDSVPRDALDDEARRLAATPYGFGRRVAPPRLPGGRPRWHPSRDPPPVDLTATPAIGPAGLAAWLDRQLAVPLDPEHDAGWRMAAAPTGDGGTAVLVTCHHLFGTGRGIIGALYGDADEDPTAGTTETPFTSASTFTTWEEALNLGDRFRLGLRGAAQVPAEVTAALRARRQDGPQPDPVPLKSPRGRDRTRRPPSNLRVCASACLPAADWDGAAARQGGTGNTLLAAVSANLLRRARISRGGTAARNLRVLLPIDLRDRDVSDTAAGSSGPTAQMTTAAVVLPGGAPQHGDLRELRARMKAAFVADTGTAPVVRGAGDVMRLLPEVLTFKVAAHAARQFDGCASNVGPVPERMLSIGSHRARDVVLLGFPIGNEALTALIRYRDRVAVSVVTDPMRLGPAADLRAWFTEELAAWGLPGVVL
jgi:diacylglycerol O-acyltransferase